MTNKEKAIREAYMDKINEHGLENVFLAECQRFASHFATKGIKGIESYKKSIASVFNAFSYYNLPIPNEKIKELLDAC